MNHVTNREHFLNLILKTVCYGVDGILFHEFEPNLRRQGIRLLNEDEMNYLLFFKNSFLYLTLKS